VSPAGVWGRERWVRGGTTTSERVISIRILWVVIAIAVGLLMILLVGVLIRPDDGKQPTGAPSPTLTGASRLPAEPQASTTSPTAARTAAARRLLR
jgi:hypothetical protein